jgi:carboxypeptidase Q
MRRELLSIAVASVVAGSATAQEPVDLEVIGKIREEGFQRSQVMDIVWHMTDLLGPRVTGSQGMRDAQTWLVEKMRSMGLSASIRPFGGPHVSWDNQYTSLHLIEPDYQPLIGYPYAFTQSTDGKVTAEVQIVRIDSAEAFDLYRGRLRGAIVLTSSPRDIPPSFAPDSQRRTPGELEELREATISSRFGVGGEAYEWDPVRNSFVTVGSAPGGPGFAPELQRFLNDEGVVAVLSAGSGRDGTVFVAGRPGSRYDRSLAGAMAAPPMIALAVEHYNRIYRLVDRGYPVRVEVEVRNRMDESGRGANVFGELRGTDLADEIVMAAGHYDSWNAGTGATDDAVGVAVALEAVRILQAIGVRPRRTIRIAGFSQEEGGKVGSRAYVEQEFGTPETGTKPAYDRFSVLFNVDNGAGRARGIFLHGNERVRPIFEAWMAPLADLGMSTITINHAFGVDAVGFDKAGLPAFQFIQDRLDYDARTHHSNMDVYDRLVPEDMRVNAVILATFLYQAAMRDGRIPREGG